MIDFYRPYKLFKQNIRLYFHSAFKCLAISFDQMHLGFLKCFKISLVVVSNVSVVLLSLTYETQKSNTYVQNNANDFAAAI